MKHCWSRCDGWTKNWIGLLWLWKRCRPPVGKTGRRLRGSWTIELRGCFRILFNHPLILAHGSDDGGNRHLSNGFLNIWIRSIECTFQFFTDTFFQFDALLFCEFNHNITPLPCSVYHGMRGERKRQHDFSIGACPAFPFLMRGWNWDSVLLAYLALLKQSKQALRRQQRQHRQEMIVPK